MEFGGNGGFQGYHRLPQPVSGTKAPEISMGLPAQMSQTINNNSSADGNECPVREQDCFMPMANVSRITRKILPPHAKISDEAKEIMQESVSEFISFITGEANDRCQNEQRKTITAEDLLYAMNHLGFDDYIEPLTRYLHRYREYDDGQHGLLRTESIRAADPINYGNAAFAPFVANHHFFSGPASMNRFLNDSSSASPSQAVAANLDPFAQGKE